MDIYQYNIEVLRHWAPEFSNQNCAVFIALAVNRNTNTISILKTEEMPNDLCAQALEQVAKALRKQTDNKLIVIK